MSIVNKDTLTLMPIDKNTTKKKKRKKERKKRNLQANITDTIILNKNFGKPNLAIHFLKVHHD